MKKRQRSSFRYSSGLHQRPEPSVRIPPCPKPIDLDFEKVPLEHRSSTLTRVVCSNKLPAAIRLTNSFVAKGSPLTLKSGELLLLCFVVEIPMVYATLGKDKDYRLPIHAKQLYEKLPLDPILDDREYKGTRDLIEAVPLPQEVRIVDAVYSAEPMAVQESGDVILIRNVDVQTHPDRGEERVIVGFDKQGREVHYSEAMDLSTYSTMVCPNLMPMSEIIKFDMPQRVRLREPEGRNCMDKKDKTKCKTMRLHRYVTEYHIITSRVKNNTLLSIPLNIDLDFEVADVTLKDIGPLLSPIFNRTNVTLGVTDVTQCKLPVNLRAVPQPQEGVLDKWIYTHEGERLVCNTHRESVASLKHVISDKQTMISTLMRNQTRDPPGPKPNVPHRRKSESSVPDAPPPVPPRPREPDLYMNIRKCYSTPLKNSEPRQDTGDGVYDVVPSRPKLDQHMSHRNQQTKIWQDREESCTEILDELESSLQTYSEKEESYEILLKERNVLKKSQEEDRREITRLKNILDDLQNNRQSNIYEDIDELLNRNYLTSRGGSANIKDTKS